VQEESSLDEPERSGSRLRAESGRGQDPRNQERAQRRPQVLLRTRPPLDRASVKASGSLLGFTRQAEGSLTCRASEPPGILLAGGDPVLVDFVELLVQRPQIVEKSESEEGAGQQVDHSTEDLPHVEAMGAEDPEKRE
jgi:hypothetical protein